jgi:hypothetical protein
VSLDKAPVLVRAADVAPGAPSGAALDGRRMSFG